MILVILVSCNCKRNKKIYQQVPKYTIGDIVYLKPDSTKAVISKVYSFTEYEVEYSDSLNVRHEQMVYSKLIF
jgi:hypothetical protein